MIVLSLSIYSSIYLSIYLSICVVVHQVSDDQGGPGGGPVSSRGAEQCPLGPRHLGGNLVVQPSGQGPTRGRQEGIYISLYSSIHALV